MTPQQETQMLQLLAEIAMSVAMSNVHLRDIQELLSKVDTNLRESSVFGWGCNKHIPSFGLGHIPACCRTLVQSGWY